MGIYITTTEALKIIAKDAPAPVTLVTLIAWCQRYQGLGQKIGGRWWIHKERLKYFIDPDRI